MTIKLLLYGYNHVYGIRTIANRQSPTRTLATWCLLSLRLFFFCCCRLCYYCYCCCCSVIFNNSLGVFFLLLLHLLLFRFSFVSFFPPIFRQESRFGVRLYTLVLPFYFIIFGQSKTIRISHSTFHIHTISFYLTRATAIYVFYSWKKKEHEVERPFMSCALCTV